MITKKAYAKINLSIDVIGKRPDGYHNLKMIMQSVSLYDTITIEWSNSLKIATDLSYLPVNENNIAYKAARLFLDEIKTDINVFIDIKKNIPVGGGLGGGSADAATVLAALNELFGYPLGSARLLELGLLCGADVPFCMTGGTCLAEGIGEILTPLPPLPPCSILLVKPSFSISTKRIFQKINMKKIIKRPDTAGLIGALEKSDIKETAVRMYNVLEDVVSDRKIELYKQKLLSSGAMGSIMTGSGSVVFGVFRTEPEALMAQFNFKELPVSTFIVKPVSNFCE